MAKNYPEVWVGRVENNLRTTDVATFLDGVPELAQEVTVMDDGGKGEKNLINIPTSDFEVEVLINNTTYPIALQEYTDDTVTVALDKFQSKVTTITDDQAIGASYDMIDNATKGHTVSINSSKYMKAIHAIAPQKDSNLTPVIKTTGDDDGTGRKVITRKDIIAMKKRFDKMQVPKIGRRLVLCSDHIADLLNLDQKFEKQYYDYGEGKVLKLYGFEIHEYEQNPHYSEAGEKMAFGSIPSDTEFEASVAFYVPNIAKKTGKTKQYFADAKTDPENQTNKLNYRHYFIAMPKRARYIGAIVSDKGENTAG